MPKRDFWFIIKSFLIWRIAITLIAYFAILYIPRFSDNFFGGRLINYETNPLLWGWANFDGEHYLSIAINGYKNLQQAFFPAYPYLVKLLSQSTDLVSNIWSGLIISNTLFLLSLILLWKIVILDYSSKIAKLTTISLLIFPTSFYFGAVYTESLFLFSSLLTYYLYRKNKYLLAGLVGILMTLTRIYGVFVLFMILVDILKNRTNLKKVIKEKTYLIAISVFGLLGYMWFCSINYGDPIAFYNLQTIVGEQHQKGVVLLPQVLFRYLKIITLSHLPIYNIQTVFLEILTAVLTIFLPLYAYSKKIRLSYIIYFLAGLLIPSMQGSFSSIPRYILVIFPAFIILGIMVDKLPKFAKITYFLLSFLWLMINTALFIRGYWIA